MTARPGDDAHETRRRADDPSTFVAATDEGSEVSAGPGTGGPTTTIGTTGTAGIAEKSTTGKAAPRGAERRRPGRRQAWVAAAVAAQLGLVGVAVAPQLSARLVGQEYRLRVAPVDPIDPFRGAYVDLAYPGLREDASTHSPGVAARTVYVPLVRDASAGAGANRWSGGPQQADPPAGPYLRCADEGFRRRCGIESWFVPQDRAAALEREVRGGQAVAVIRVDGDGNAAIVDLQGVGTGASTR